MLITSDFLEQFKSCSKGLVKFNRLFPNGLDSRSVEDIRLAIKNRLYFDWAMGAFSDVFDSEDVICEILAYKGYLLQFVKVLITQKMVDIAINNTSRAFPYVPACFQTEEMTYRALAYDSEYLKSVKIPITQKMVDIAMKNNIYAFPWVPVEFQTEEMVYKVLTYGGRYLKDVKIPITQRMVDIAIDNNINACRYVPERFKTEELTRRFENVNNE